MPFYALHIVSIKHAACTLARYAFETTFGQLESIQITNNVNQYCQLSKRQI